MILDEETANKTAQALSQSIKEGLKGADIWDYEYNSPDFKMIQNLQQNVYEFSFAKNHQQLKATTAAMVDSDEKLLPFDQFRDIAERINNEFNVVHLETEYDTAVGSAQMASRWKDFSEEEDIFPNLRFETVGDSNVRPSHERLDGVTLPINDKFWDTYYPPLGWRCRCDVTQQDGDVQLTEKKHIEVPDDVPKMFQTNLGKSGLAFPKDHPYYDHVPKSVMKAAGNNNPYNYQKAYTGKKGGYWVKNQMSKASKDQEEILNTLADLGEQIIQLPEMPGNTKGQRTLKAMAQPKSIKPEKNVDHYNARTKRPIEIKSIQSTKTAIERSIRDAGNSVQTGETEVCMKLDGAISLIDLKDALQNSTRRAKAVSHVWVMDKNNKLTIYDRETILGWNIKKRK